MKDTLILKLVEMLLSSEPSEEEKINVPAKQGAHPMLGRRCLVRTYSAGVHIGDIVYVDGMEVKLEKSLRLWKWTDGGLSLSAVANNGIKGGRLNRTGEVFLTNVIEMIPTSRNAEVSYERFIED
jgi:hypothetical protein